MNLILANTEPFFRFHRFREEFDRNMRVAHGGLQMLREQSVDGAKSPSDTLVTMPGDEPWGFPRTWRNGSLLVAKSERFLSHLGLVRVMSAFEDFLVNVRAEHDRYQMLIGKAAPQKSLSDDGDDDDEVRERLRSFCEEFNWATDDLDCILPLFDFFTIARNCIAHRSGRASNALVKYVASDELKACVLNWKTINGNGLPSLPRISAGKELPFQPRHAVLASIVCYEAAKYINSKLVELLGERGLVFMAAHHSLLSGDPIERGKEKTADRRINQVLSGRYRVSGNDSESTIRILKELNQWKRCLNQFKRMYPEPNA